MTETYSVGINLRLIDGVTGGLGRISKSLMATNAQAQALQAKLTRIGHTVGMGMGLIAIGAGIAAPLVAATKEAEKYQHQITMMRQAGMDTAEIAGSIGAAWQTSSKIITSTATENLKIISDLRTVFGSTSEAISFMPTMAKMQGAYSSILDHKLAGQAAPQTFAAAKFADMMGKVQNAQQFSQTMDSLMRTTGATLGRVLPSDFQAVAKYAKTSKYQFSDKFMYGVIPELVLESKTTGGGGASRVGTALEAFSRLVVKGVLNKQSAAMFDKLGLIPQGAMLKTTTTGTTLKNGLVGADIAAQNPLQWVSEVLLPALQKHYHTADRTRLAQIASTLMRSNSLAGGLTSEFILKPFQYERYGKLLSKVPGLDQTYGTAMKSDPATNWKALAASLENFKTAIGEHVVPLIVPMINRLTQSLQQSAAFLHNHPGFTKLITGLMAASSGALIASGSLMVSKGAFQGLRLVAPLIGGLVRLNPTMIALSAAAILLWMNFDKVKGWLDEHSGFINHVGASLVVTFKKIGLAIQNLINQIGDALEGINTMLGGVPGAVLQGFGANLKSMIDQATTVSAKQQLLDQKVLRNAGIEPIGKGAAKQAASSPAREAGKKTVVNEHNEYHITNNINGQQDPMKVGDEVMKKMASGLDRAKRGISRAGGVRRSQYAFGTGR